MIQRLVFFVFVLFTFFACQQQLASSKLSDASSENVKSMIGDSFIGTKSIGRTMEVSPEYSRRQALISEASTKELVGLIRHENPVIGLSAFEGLVGREYPEIKPFLDYFAKSKGQVHYINGDLSSVISTLEYAFVNVLGMPLHDIEVSLDTNSIYVFNMAERAIYVKQIQAFQQKMKVQ